MIDDCRGVLCQTSTAQQFQAEIRKQIGAFVGSQDVFLTIYEPGLFEVLEEGHEDIWATNGSSYAN
jgi:hypothetical protein